MKDLNFYFAPTVVGFGKCNLEKRILSILNYKKPTILSTVLSSFLAIGFGTTAAFAVTTPKIEEPNTVPDHPLPAVVTESEPVIEDNRADESFETGEAEPVGQEEVSESENLPGNNDIWLEPDENGISYNRFGNLVRIPTHILDAGALTSYSFTKIYKDENGTLYVHALLDEETPTGFVYFIYFGDEFAVLTNTESVWLDSESVFRQMRDNGMIPNSNECSHNLIPLS